jgi:hypothetical protein
LDLLSTLLLFTGLTLWVAMLVLIYSCYTTMQAYVVHVEDLVGPYMSRAANVTLNILSNADATTKSVRFAAESGEQVVSTSLPQMFTALNATRDVVGRMERLAAHPVVKVTLGDD